jgi:hypothetical protein
MIDLYVSLNIDFAFSSTCADCSSVLTKMMFGLEGMFSSWLPLSVLCFLSFSRVSAAALSIAKTVSLSFDQIDTSKLLRIRIRER